ncbi:MAG: EpsI family protein [Desulforhopalus sp.]|jgi:EpsI family protein
MQITKKLLILSCILFISCLAIYSRYRSPDNISKVPLAEYLSQIEGYKIDRTIDLSDDHITMLNLDDYFFTDFKGPNGAVNLYIGYYYSANKAYASHSPLVCYPSQGWAIDQKPKKGQLDVNKSTINYEEIITSFGDKKELVLYWYQAGEKSNTQVYKNKIDMGYNKLVNNDEQHGFIRVAAPITESYAKSKEASINFIKTFYPQLTTYILSKKGTGHANTQF